MSIKRERDEGHFFHGDGSKTDGTPGAHQFWVSLRVHPPYNNVDVVAGPIESQRPQLTHKKMINFPTTTKKPQCARAELGQLKKRHQKKRTTKQTCCLSLFVPIIQIIISIVVGRPF